MAACVRKLLDDDSASSAPLFSPPPPSFIYDGPKQYNDFSPYLIPLFFALGAAFLIVAYFTFVKKFYISPNNQTRAAPQNLDENYSPVIDHPAWLISTIGLEPSVIDSIPVFKYEKNEGLIAGTMCSICLSEFVEDETLRFLPKCSHAFHVPCIDMWLRSHKTCPTCRALIVPESAVNIQTNESGSSSNNFRPIHESFNENLGDFGEVECYQGGSEIVRRNENIVARPRGMNENNEIVTKKSPSMMMSCGFRVFSDLGGYREKVEAEPEQMRRSISMDPSSASSVYRAMNNTNEMKVEIAQLLQTKDVKYEKHDNGVNATSRISKIIKSSSLRFSLRRGPVLMKRSFSSSEN